MLLITKYLNLLCFSWDFRTMAGHGNISEFLDNKSAGGKSRFEHAALHNFQIETTSTIGPPATFPVPGNPGVQGVSAAFTFSVTSPPASGRGFFRLFPEGAGGWKVFTVLMNLAELAGHEEPTGRPLISGDIIWEEERAKKIIEIENDPTVVISLSNLSLSVCIPSTEFSQSAVVRLASCVERDSAEWEFVRWL
jgi:hypothetical protein